MRETGIGTSLILLATGAVLAFAVHVRSTAIDLNTIGAILMIIGIIGVLVSFAFLSENAWFYGRRTYVDDDRMTPPHEHVRTTDVVVDDDRGPHVERHIRAS